MNSFGHFYIIMNATLSTLNHLILNHVCRICFLFVGQGRTSITLILVHWKEKLGHFADK